MIDNDDLLKEISQTQLNELSDIHGKGSLDQDIIDDAINDAISFIESFIILPDSPTPLLKDILVFMTIYELKKRNGLVSDVDKETKKENEAYLIKMSTGRLKTESLNGLTASVKENSKPFAFRHNPKRRVDKRGFR